MFTYSIKKLKSPNMVSKRFDCISRLDGQTVILEMYVPLWDRVYSKATRPQAPIFIGHSTQGTAIHKAPKCLPNHWLHPYAPLLKLPSDSSCFKVIWINSLSVMELESLPFGSRLAIHFEKEFLNSTNPGDSNPAFLIFNKQACHAR